MESSDPLTCAQSYRGTDIAVCPFNRSHVMARKRFQYHIIACRKNYTGPPLVVCPFNSCEYIRPEDMEEHLAECPSRQAKALDFMLSMDAQNKSN